MLTDGVITLRPPEPGDRDALIALRDEQFHRFMGEGSPEPRPTFCVTVDGAVVGWVDADHEDGHHWLQPHEANLGYALHPDHRGRGYATRAVMLLLHHLAQTGQWSVATLAIDFGNDWSVGIARRCGFTEHGTIVGDKESRFFKRPVPPLTYTDGTVTIRPFAASDLERDLEAKDDVQQQWLWEAWQREHWGSMTAEEQRAHAARGIEGHLADGRNGPKWSFVIDVGGSYMGHVDCDLANEHVPAGEANVSYSSHPQARGKGHVSAAVRLITQFVRDHTGARELHLVVHPDNEASLRVARAAGASETKRFVDQHGTTMVRHVLEITR